MTAQLVAQSVAALAARTAASLAKEAKVDVELRNALSTSKLDSNTVRIGDYDIRKDDTSESPAFSICRAKTGAILVDDVVYYETCRHIVAMLNDGAPIKTMSINRYIRENTQYRRVVNDVLTYRAQIHLYAERGDENRMTLIENRLSEAEARADHLRNRLLSGKA